jgi:hypothetical protein
MMQSAENRTVPELLRSLADDVAQLVRGEISLAKSESQDKLNQVIQAVLAILAGGVLGLAALIILLDALVYGLAEHIPAWLAAVIVGGIVAIIGYVLVHKGQKDLSASSLTPSRTMGNLQRDAKLAKEHVS